MLKFRNNIPLDYSLCADTVTVYHREGLTRQVLDGVCYEFTTHRQVDGGIARVSRSFRLVIPGDRRICPGDKVLLGIGPEISRWEDLAVETTDTMGLVTSVKPCYYKGNLCHTEARG